MALDVTSEVTEKNRIVAALGIEIARIKDAHAAEIRCIESQFAIARDRLRMVNEFAGKLSAAFRAVA